MIAIINIGKTLERTSKYFNSNYNPTNLIIANIIITFVFIIATTQTIKTDVIEGVISMTSLLMAFMISILVLFISIKEKEKEIIEETSSLINFTFLIGIIILFFSIIGMQFSESEYYFLVSAIIITLLAYFLVLTLNIIKCIEFISHR